MTQQFINVLPYPIRQAKFAQTLGDGVSTSFTVAHNLGTQDVISYVYLISTGDAILCQMQSINTVQAVFTFATPPAVNSVRVVIMG